MYHCNHNLSAHQSKNCKLVHKNMNKHSDGIVDDDLTIEGNQPYTCRECGKKFSTRSSEQIHAKTYRSLDPESINLHSSIFSCEDPFDVCCRVECGRSRPTSIGVDDFGFETYSYPSNRKSSFSSFFKARILGNDNSAEFGEFPWMVGILLNGAYECGGSLIHPRVTLTAAHCVHGKAGWFNVRVGEYDWESNEDPLPQDQNAKMIIVHGEYNPRTVVNDIALLIVEKPFKLGHSVGVMCIPPPNVKYGRTDCMASGWGKSSYYETSYETVLKKTLLPLVDRATCIRMLGTFIGPHFTLDPSFICAGGEENKDTCRGDGGSPLVCPIPNHEYRYEQAGIVAWGVKCGVRNAPGVYVNVALFSSWIDANMDNLGFDKSIYKYS